MFYRGPINLIGAAVRSPVQYLSERQLAILDFGTIAPGRFLYMFRRGAELISRNSHSMTFEAKGLMCQILRLHFGDGTLSHTAYLPFVATAGPSESS